MSDPLLPEGDGHTELSEDDREGLIPSYIATRADLFDAEQRNITSALQLRSPTTDVLLDDKYLRDLHRAMFAQVWKWAGQYRKHETDIGISPLQIPTAVRTLIDDTRIWVEMETYDPDELAARFHHRLVQIHPFPNGNGRHGRIVADHLLQSMSEPVFTWGRNLDVTTDDLRRRYRQALEWADGGSIDELLASCRS